MITHFQYKPLFEHLPGWDISFFYKGKYYDAVYHKDGRIEWKKEKPDSGHLKDITSHIHELMLFHVYE